MWRKLVLITFLVFALVCSLSAPFHVQMVEASGTIYIRATGLVEGTDKITNANNVSYTFTDDINDSIVVERSNVIVDGNGYTLNGSWSLMYGFNLTSISNVTITNVNVVGFGYGIYLQSSTLNVILENNITNNDNGIYLDSSSNNTISGNKITDNTGISVDNSSNNIISGNNITANNRFGIWVLSNSRYNTITRNNIDNNYQGITVQVSNYNTVVGNNITRNNDYGVFLFVGIHDNTFYHNNFLGNAHHVGTYIPSVHVWDNGFPSGGNYWSNYTGVDLDHDGIGDTEHVINENNTDNYPLMGMFSDFKATSEYHVQTICNSTISGFQFNGTAITFDVSSGNETAGFCRICIPKALMNETYRVFVNGTEILPAPLPLPCSNNTHNYIYFNYTHSKQEVIIIPEFPSLILLPLFMIATLLAVMIYRKTIKSTRI